MLPFPLLLFAALPAAPQDAAPRVLSDAHHPWAPPAGLEEWEAERERIRRQILVAAGLWPLPEREAPRAWIHGRVEREAYTVEKMIVESLPGHYVTGSLYRPRGEGPFAAVLSPHGHWRDGRFHRAGDDEVARLLASGAEELECAARSHLQARCVHLARMGCVVFHYDMVGYASSTAIDHRAGFDDAAALASGQGVFGLQTWNSLRALDFLASLADVDASRIGVTGASGGGTQTFILCAIDDRPAVAFPAAMVSTAMQGGCVCENAPYLRLDRNNVALAACFAPRPMALSGADDWTAGFMTSGFPELRSVYALYGAEDRVAARVWKEYPHNYNRHARAMMYAWFHEHLALDGEAPPEEWEFEPLTREELDAWHGFDAFEGRGLAVGELRLSWQEHVAPRADPGTARTALATMLGVHELEAGLIHFDAELVHAGEGRREEPQRVVLWVVAREEAAVLGEEPWLNAVARLRRAGWEVVSYEPRRGAGSPPSSEGYAGFAWCYNRPRVLEGAQEVYLAVQELERRYADLAIDLVGVGEAGAWVVLAAHALRGRIGRVVVEGRAVAPAAGLDDPAFLPYGKLLAPLLDAPRPHWRVVGALTPELVPSLVAGDPE